MSESGWAALDDRFDFDWALLSRPPPPGDRMQDVLDADSAWALVFVDDAAAVYVKREGALEPLARRFEYRLLGAGQQRLERVAAACATDSALREPVRSELSRQIAASAASGLAHSFLANLALAEQRWEEARVELERALAKHPRTPEAHLRLATIALATAKPYLAIEELERERAAGGAAAVLDARFGLAYQQLGDMGRARAAYRRALARDPGNPRLVELLRQVEAGGRNIP